MPTQASPRQAKNAPLLKPLLRGHSHQAAFFYTLGACTMLISKSSTTLALMASIIYGISLCGLFGISALYHRPNWSPAKRVWMRKLDHAAIYILIAGTSTPICLLALPLDSGMRILQLIWGAALFGIFQSLVWAHAPKWVSSLLYITVGCLIVPFLADLKAALILSDIYLIFSGGLVYIVGAIIYAFKRPDPSQKYFGYHEIFHLLVIIGACLHFIVVNRLIH